MHPEEYRAAREIVRHVISNTIDISHYESTAKKLARLLEILMQDTSESIFSYFHENIDPRKQGRPGFLRVMCIDLDRQMECIDQIRADDLKPRVITFDHFRRNNDSETPLP